MNETNTKQTASPSPRTHCAFCGDTVEAPTEDGGTTTCADCERDLDGYGDPGDEEPSTLQWIGGGLATACRTIVYGALRALGVTGTVFAGILVDVLFFAILGIALGIIALIAIWVLSVAGVEVSITGVPF